MAGVCSKGMSEPLALTFYAILRVCTALLRRGFQMGGVNTFVGHFGM